MDRGNAEQMDLSEAEEPASMGPRSMDRGNGRILRGTPFGVDRFNGAAVHGPRKYLIFCNTDPTTA